MTRITAEQVRPFDSGAQYGDWTGCNCNRCTKGAHMLGPDALPTCPIELSLGEAYFGDGNVSADIAQRMGHTEHGARYVWPCAEVEWTEGWKAEYLQRKATQP